MSHRLAEQITSLLLRHPYVVVPELGGFIRQRIPAYYDEAKSVVVPPKAELLFSQELSHSDGLLEESYATLLGVSVRRGRLALEEDIKELRHALIQEGSAELLGLGTLQMTPSGSISFTPQASSHAVLAAGYGYAPLSLSLLAGGRSAVATPAERTPEPQPRTEVHTTKSREYIQLRLPKRSIGYILAVLASVLVLMPWGRGAETGRGFQTAYLPADSSAEKLFGTATLEEPVVEVAPDTIPAVEAEPEGLRYLSEPDGRYHVIVATEPTKERIEGYYQTLLAQTDSTYRDMQAIYSSTGKVIRLSLASFATSAEAYSFLETFVKEHPSYKTTWVLHNL